ncbi:Nuclear transcription factor Y subunit C-9-like protein [Heracleum sosnowskyi]|uniref:Nuclear transcription factor Y subunit C-9-like protein n=1 Tax=Heracleum sosnowskyi TaxID=360622 RepID=A0AAD8IYA5_9APIA|nr:Nuclear transcription factor Y subunit C-9-like protein [Heracleum sosnowskyi]
MKVNKDVKVEASDAPVLVSKACEMFISDLTLRDWKHKETNKSKLLQTKNITATISETEAFNFLDDTVPSLPIQQGDTRSTMNHTHVGSSAELVQRQYVTQQHHVGPSGTTFDEQHQIRQSEKAFYACGQSLQSQEDLTALYVLVSASAAEPEKTSP